MDNFIHHYGQEGIQIAQRNCYRIATEVQAVGRQLQHEDLVLRCLNQNHLELSKNMFVGNVSLTEASQKNFGLMGTEMAETALSAIESHSNLIWTLGGTPEPLKQS